MPASSESPKDPWPTLVESYALLAEMYRLARELQKSHLAGFEEELPAIIRQSAELEQFISADHVQRVLAGLFPFPCRGPDGRPCSIPSEAIGGLKEAAASICDAAKRDLQLYRGRTFDAFKLFEEALDVLSIVMSALDDNYIFPADLPDVKQITRHSSSQDGPVQPAPAGKPSDLADGSPPPDAADDWTWQAVADELEARRERKYQADELLRRAELYVRETSSDLADGSPAPDAADGWTWQAVVDELEALRKKHEPYTSQEILGAKIGCGGWLVGKAMRQGPVELQEWRLQSKQRGESRRNVTPEAAEVAFDSTPQRCEPDPADISDPADAQRTMDRLIEEMGKRSGEKAQAQLKQEIEAGKYNVAELERLAAEWLPDPDEEQQARRRKTKIKRAD